MRLGKLDWVHTDGHNMNDLLAVALAAALGLIVGFSAARRVRARRQTAPAVSTETAPQPEALQDARIALDILEHMSDGVVVLDDALRPFFANAAAIRILGLQGPDLPAYLAPPQLTEAVRDALEEKGRQRLVEVSYPSRLSLQVQAEPLEGGPVMVVLQDVSEELRTQRIRKEFVAHASHELKSPVASLQALTEAMVQALRDDPAAAARFSDKVLSESHRLGKLVADLLDLSRLEEPATTPHGHCDLSRLAETELSEAREAAEAGGLRIEVEVENGLVLSGDPQQVALLIRNLLGNAIQYTPEGGLVKLVARRNGQSAVLRVEDTGIGIPQEAQSRVFERFYRVDRARSRARGGTGLGLAIVKHVAELHDATIRVESEVGRGSVFEVSFPLSEELLEGPQRRQGQRESA